MRTKIIYLIAVILLSLSCTEEQETLEVRSLSYVNNNVTLTVGEGFVSDVPEVDGDGNFTFSFSDVSANDFEGITIDESTGVITVEEGNTLKGGIRYIFTVAVSNEDVTEVFENAFVIDMLALNIPRNLIYEPDSISIKVGQGYVSDTPQVEGEGEMTFSFADVSANDFEGITIDESTGVITIAEGNTLTANISYVIAVAVSNEDFTEVFQSAFVIEMIALDPPKNLTYEPDSISVALATDSSSVAPNIDGLTPLTFTFENSEELPAFLSINEETGIISINGEISEAGDYNISLSVINEDGEATFENAYTVKILYPEAIADFTFAVNGNDPYAIDFTNTSQNAVSYEWDFGDGSGVSTEENPTHAYDAVGTYQVTLSATNVDGFTNSVSKEIIIDVPEPTESILEIIGSSQDHTQLEEFINAYPDLVSALGGNDLTLFAPNDNAFEKLRVTLGVEDLNQVNPAVIEAVLAFHAVQSVELRASFTEDTSLPTLQGEEITFNAQGNIASGGTDTDVEFVGDEILATNGVVHVVETILIPPTIFEVIGTSLGKVSQTILLSADFSTLAAAIAKADEYAAVEGVTPLSTILAGGAEGLPQITVFAPVNDVFAAAGITLDAFTAQQWYGIIANHVLGQKLLSTQFAEAQTYETLAGGAITFLPSGALDSDGVAGGEATFIDGAIDIESENGVVHAIAGVLVPASSGRYAVDAKYNLK